MSGTVEYLISIRGQIQAGIDAAFKNIGSAAQQMTKQVNAAEAAIGRAGKAQAAQAAATAAAVQKAQATQIAAMAAADRQRRNSIAETTRWYASNGKSAAAEEKALAKQIAMQEKATTAAQKAAAKRNSFFGGGHGGGDGVMGNMMSAGIVGYMGIHAVKGMGHFLDHANEQMMARQRMAMVGFKGEIMSEADKVATELTGKYKNISKAGVLEQMYEGVAIHGDAQHALENVEAQVRLASFLQSWDGGKHAGKSKDWNREVFAAIKSMEMMGVLNEHDPEKKKADINNYLGAMMSMKTLYGDQAKLSEYLTAQKRAGASFYRLGEDFRFGILPAMIQERGGSMVGQQLMTGFQTIVGGTKLRKSQIAAMKGYGIYDDKTGRFKQQFVDSYLHNPFETAQMLAGEIAKKHGLDPAKAGDLEKLKDFMAKDMSWLFPNRNAAGVFMDMNMNNKNFLKHAEALKAVRQEMDAIAKGEFFAAKTWGGAQASVSKQWGNLLSELGGPMMAPAMAGLNGLASAFNNATGSVHAWVAANPDMAATMGKVATWGTAGLAAAAGLAAVGFAVKALGSGLGALGLGRVASGLWTATKFTGRLSGKLARAVLWGGRLKALTGIGAAFAIGAAVYQNWDKLAASFERVANAKNKIGQVNREVSNLGEWLRGTAFGQKARAMLGLDDLDRVHAMRARAAPWQHGREVLADIQRRRAQYSANGGLDLGTTGSGAGMWNDWISRRLQRAQNAPIVGGPGFGNDVQKFWNAGPSAPGAGPGAKVASAQAQRVQVESRVQVQTHFDAVKIQPGTLTVTYNGPIGGPGSVPVNGSGGHPRGEAMPATTSTSAGGP